MNILKRVSIVTGMCLLAILACSQPGKIDSALIARPLFHFQPEYTLDAPSDPSSWQRQNAGLHVSFASTDEAYFRTEVPALKNETNALEETGWKGERVNTMILVWSPDTIQQVRFIVSDLKDGRGNILSKNNLQLNLVRYVLSNYPYDAGDVSCGEGPVDKAYLMPDRFEAFDRFDMPGRTVRPVWLSLNIPQNAAPGIYNGTVEVKSSKGESTLQLKIKVQNQILPKPYNWTFRLDLWQNPWVIAEYYHVKPWSAEHLTLLEKHLKLYADAGGKFITTYAVHSPWADNSYMIEGAMIEWIRTKNGSWKFDYSIFDTYVQLAIKTGIDKAITIYTPIPWGERFRYHDEASGNYMYERWLPTSDTFKRNWNIFLTDLKAHLQKKGWFDKTYIGINEN
ncbi:MAG TPA: glycoside hydrolase domain-containing protein, partial [Chitinophagaceae bacterium]|nr:glycoside hydrolase domain-containing protein [Chitinophagaceae bacterium]